MVNITILKDGITVDGRTYSRGDVAPADPDLAIKLVSEGCAEYSDPPVKTAYLNAVRIRAASLLNAVTIALGLGKG